MEYELRIAGPDDVIVFSDELEAHQRANEINKQYLEYRAKNPNAEVLYMATVHEVDDPETRFSAASWLNVGLGTV